jgi:hypothetical protein
MKRYGYTALAANREGKLFRADWLDIDAPTAAIEAHVTVHERENGVIASEADVFPRDKFSPALTDDDITRDNHLTAEFFDPEPLANAVAAVFDASLSFFMCHGLKIFSILSRR